MSAARSPLASAIPELAQLETPEEREAWLDANAESGAL